MRKLLHIALVCTFLTALTLSASAEGVEAQEAFDQLRTLAGTWHGEPEAKGMEAEGGEEEMAGKAHHEIEVSAAGTVIMETMAPGTPHEMINMYHLDGEDLVMTHYCAGGNQPKMKLDRAGSTAKKLVFDFDGGTNLDPAKDPHIHSAQIELEGDGRLKSVWNSYMGGEPAGQMVFHLSRSN